MRHGPRDRDLAAVFEADGEASREIVICDRRPGARYSRRDSKAARAGGLLGRLKRKATTGAASFAQELDLLPAIRAEAVNVLDDCPAARAPGRKREIEHRSRAPTNNPSYLHCLLVARREASHKHAVPDLFDMELRALRRERAARMGPELFLLERAFADCLERIELQDRRFERALMIGCPDPAWPERLRIVVGHVDVRDPGPLFAAAGEGEVIVEDAWEPPSQTYDLVIAIGTLDTVNSLPIALRLIGYAMKADALLIGVISGGETLPQLRSAMRAADALAGGASAHVHPRIEPSALPALLSEAGFARPVVDVDRVQVSYLSMDRLIGDLRSMGATNVLRSRAAPLGRAQHKAAVRAFAEAGDGERTTETFEILHFAAWIPGKELMPR